MLISVNAIPPRNILIAEDEDEEWPAVAPRGRARGSSAPGCQPVNTRFTIISELLRSPLPKLAGERHICVNGRTQEQHGRTRPQIWQHTSDRDTYLLFHASHRCATRKVEVMWAGAGHSPKQQSSQSGDQCPPGLAVHTICVTGWKTRKLVGAVQTQWRSAPHYQRKRWP